MRLAFLLLLIPGLAFAQTDLTWQHDNLIVQDAQSGQGAPVVIRIDNEASSADAWDIRDLCKSGVGISASFDARVLSWRPTFSSSYCDAQGQIAKSANRDVVLGYFEQVGTPALSQYPASLDIAIPDATVTQSGADLRIDITAALTEDIDSVNLWDPVADTIITSDMRTENSATLAVEEGGKHVALEAIVSSPWISVKFDCTGTGCPTSSVIDDTVPFSYPSDSGVDNLDAGWVATDGSATLAITPYDGAGATGSAGTARNFDIYFVEAGVPRPALTLTDYDLYLDFNEQTGLTAFDATAGNNDGTLTNGVAWFDGGVQLDGVNDYIDLGNYDPSGGTGLSVSIWFNSDNIGNCPALDCRLFSKGTSISTADHWLMFSLIDNGVGDQAALRARIKIDGTTQTVQGNSSGPILDGILYHAVLTYDGTDIKLYREGQELTLTTSGNFPGTLDTGAAIASWAGDQPTAGGREFDGWMDELKIWNRALTAAEVLQLYGEGVNNPPPSPVAAVAVDDVCSVNEDSFFDCIVLANDTGTAPLTASNPTNLVGFTGTLAVQGNGTIRVTPDIGQNDDGTFDYTVTNQAGSDTGQVAVTLVAPSPPSNFANMCAEAGVVMCADFDVDFNNHNFLNVVNSTPPVVDTTTKFEGAGALRMTIEPESGFNPTGDVGWGFNDITSGNLYLSVRIRLGDDPSEATATGMATLLKNQVYTRMSSMKFFQLVPGSKSCDGESVLFVTSANFSILSGIPELNHSCGGFPFREGTSWQPRIGDIDNCGFNYINTQRAAGDPVEGQLDVPAGPCQLFYDDTWHLVELEIQIGTKVRLWIDGVLTVDATQTANGTTPAGPFAQLYIVNYMTGHQAGDMDSEGRKHVWYDNLIISTNCITSC